MGRDAFGNPCAGLHAFTVRIRPPLSSYGGSRAPEVTISKLPDGSATCKWVPRDAGTHHVGVFLGGIAIEGSEFACNVTV